MDNHALKNIVSNHGNLVTQAIRVVQEQTAKREKKEEAA